MANNSILNGTSIRQALYQCLENDVKINPDIPNTFQMLEADLSRPYMITVYMSFENTANNIKSSMLGITFGSSNIKDRNQDGTTVDTGKPYYFIEYADLDTNDKGDAIELDINCKDNNNLRTYYIGFYLKNGNNRTPMTPDNFKIRKNMKFGYFHNLYTFSAATPADAPNIITITGNLANSNGYYTTTDNKATIDEIHPKTENIGSVGTAENYYKSAYIANINTDRVIPISAANNADKTVVVGSTIGLDAQRYEHGYYDICDISTMHGGFISAVTIDNGGLGKFGSLQIDDIIIDNNLINWSKPKTGPVINTNGGNIQLGSGALDFTSDKRLKDIDKIYSESEDISKAIANTKIYSYRFKGDSRERLGIMAQDLEKNLPSALRPAFIKKEDDSANSGLKDKMTIDKTDLVFLLWSEVQRLQKKVEELEDQIKESNRSEIES